MNYFISNLESKDGVTVISNVENPANAFGCGFVLYTVTGKAHIVSYDIDEAQFDGAECVVEHIIYPSLKAAQVAFAEI